MNKKNAHSHPSNLSHNYLARTKDTGMHIHMLGNQMGIKQTKDEFSIVILFVS